MRTTPQHLAAEYRASGAWSEQCIGHLFAAAAAVGEEEDIGFVG